MRRLRRGGAQGARVRERKLVAPGVGTREDLHRLLCNFCQEPLPQA